VLVSLISYWAINASAQQPEPLVDEWPPASDYEHRNSATQQGKLSVIRPIMVQVPQFSSKPRIHHLEVWRPAERCIINLS
jgi:hypothetical protein